MASPFRKRHVQAYAPGESRAQKLEGRRPRIIQGKHPTKMYELFGDLQGSGEDRPAQNDKGMAFPVDAKGATFPWRLEPETQ